MNRFNCNDNYKQDLIEYTEQVFEKFGIFSPTGEREILCLADEGNTVALKLYADLIFYRKLFRKHPYTDAFSLYMSSAGIFVDDTGKWHRAGSSYPLSFCSLGYYLVNYRRNSVLRECEPIAAIDCLTFPERLSCALELAVACIDHTGSAEAVNLVGRILQEAASDEAVFSKMKPVIEENIASHDFSIFAGGEKETNAGDSAANGLSCENAAACSGTAGKFFLAAARNGYVYACNNIAARIAENILREAAAGADENALRPQIDRYIYYLSYAADRYEPYAGNRLGRFFMTGEVRSGDRKATFRSYVDKTLAKEYLYKATVYPDSNSAWAFLNLMRFFPEDYAADIELLDEHMASIQKLNPKVYEIALDMV